MVVVKSTWVGIKVKEYNGNITEVARIMNLKGI